METQKEKVLKDAVLCFLIRAGKILLGIKSKKIGQGRLNGYGGGIDNGETPEQAAIRELWEEGKVKADPKSLVKVAIVDFHNQNSDGFCFTCKVHVYFLYEWEGEPQETDELLSPEWFDASNLPFEKMLLADRVWLPLAISGKKVIGEAWYGPFQRTLLKEVECRCVDSFDS